MNRAGIAIAFLVSSATAAGCGPTSADLCYSVQNGVRDVMYECGYGSIASYYVIHLPGETVTACPNVRRVERREEITDQCLPFLAEVQCDVISPADPFAWVPPFCAPDHFVVVR